MVFNAFWNPYSTQFQHLRGENPYSIRKNLNSIQILILIFLLFSSIIFRGSKLVQRFGACEGGETQRKSTFTLLLQ